MRSPEGTATDLCDTFMGFFVLGSRGAVAFAGALVDFVAGLIGDFVTAARPFFFLAGLLFVILEVGFTMFFADVDGLRGDARGVILPVAGTAFAGFLGAIFRRVRRQRDQSK